MSKWLDKSAYEQFKGGLKEDESASNFSNPYSDKLFPAKDQKGLPFKGTADTPQVYEMRMLQDPKNGKGYMKYYYHMMKGTDGKYHFFICPKTFDFNAYCPCCSVSNKLYAGSDDDKKLAKEWKRKERFVGNIFLRIDPRDKARPDDKKLEGKNLLYEFPTQVEKIVKEQINDEKNGLGMSIYDPGDDGYDFILKVGSKPAPDGKAWPDYVMSTFARKPSSLGTDKEIKAIMEGRHSIEDYIKASDSPREKMIDLLKKEMLFDLVSSEIDRFSGSDEKKEEPRQKNESKSEDPAPKKEDPKPAKNEEGEGLSEEDLLAELRDL